MDEYMASDVLSQKNIIIKNKANDKTCYLEYVDGYLTCTVIHKIGTPCLMNKQNGNI